MVQTKKNSKKSAKTKSKMYVQYPRKVNTVQKWKSKENDVIVLMFIYIITPESNTIIECVAKKQKHKRMQTLFATYA